MSILIDVADALVTSLNAGSFSEEFTAERRLLPKYDVRDLDDLLVTVIPIDRGVEQIERGGLDNTIMVNIGIQKKTKNDLSDVETLLDLGDEIIEHVYSASLAGVAALFVRASIEISYDVDTLQEQTAFLAVLSVTYKVFT